MTSRAYEYRILDGELDELIPSLPAIAIEGAKGVGKTRTARERARTTFELDDPAVAAVAAADPRRLLEGPSPVLIDEWQRVPETWDLVRRAVDDDGRPGRFLLTGSATPRDSGTHSGAGRIIRLRMRPMTLAERGVEQPTVSLRSLLGGAAASIAGSTTVALTEYVEEMCQSGFPAIRGLADRARRMQLDGYIDRIVDRDFPELGHPIRNPGTLRRWMAAYASATATTASYERIRDAATAGEGDKPAKTTTIPFRDVLERLWILDTVPAWTPTRNSFNRLASAPKHQLCDPALAARLVGADPAALLGDPRALPTVQRDGLFLGQLFESLVTLDIRVYAQASEATVSHFRTSSGDREVDLIVERADRRVLAIEVKLARTVGDADSKHLRWLRDQLGPDLIDAIIVTTGPDAYRRADGIAVVPAALLGP